MAENFYIAAVPAVRESSVFTTYVCMLVYWVFFVCFWYPSFVHFSSNPPSYQFSNVIQCILPRFTKKQPRKHQLQIFYKNQIGLLSIIKENLYMAKISFAPSEGWIALFALLGGLKPPGRSGNWSSICR